MAGAGIKPGTAYGQSDEWGYQTAEGKTYCYDLHATILHLMGIDHKKLTYLSNGINRRLTDVHGHVINEILVSTYVNRYKSHRLAKGYCGKAEIIRIRRKRRNQRI